MLPKANHLASPIRQGRTSPDGPTIYFSYPAPQLFSGIVFFLSEVTISTNPGYCCFILLNIFFNSFVSVSENDLYSGCALPIGRTDENANCLAPPFFYNIQFYEYQLFLQKNLHYGYRRKVLIKTAVLLWYHISFPRLFTLLLLLRVKS